VGRGEKLGESVGALPFEDMTVEDLLRIVRGLPPEESAVNAVARGLYYLDSRALAALLKELAKVGCTSVPSEVYNFPLSLVYGSPQVFASGDTHIHTHTRGTGPLRSVQP